MTLLSTTARSLERDEDKVNRITRESDHESAADRAVGVGPQEHRDGRAHDSDAFGGASRDPNDQDAVADEAARDDRTVQGADHVMTYAAGDGVPDAVDSDADADGVTDNAQPDRIRSLQESINQQPETATPDRVVDLSNPPPPPPTPELVGQGPASSPPESDTWGSRVRKMVDPQYRKSLSNEPSVHRGAAPRQSGRGRQEQRASRRGRR